VVGVHEEADAADAGRHRPGEPGGIIEREIAGAFREEHEAHVVGLSGRRCVDRGTVAHAADLDARHAQRLWEIASAAAPGSSAPVIGRPTTRMLAPALMASRGVITRFWSPTALPAGRMPGTTRNPSGHAARIAATSCAEQTMPSSPAPSASAASLRT